MNHLGAFGLCGGSVRVGRNSCIVTLTLLALSLVSANSLFGSTLAYWRFEGDGVTTPVAGTSQVEDTNGRDINVTFPNPPGIAVPDVSGNGNTVRAWDHAFAGHTYQSNVANTIIPQTGETNSFSVQNAGNFPAMSTWSLKNSPSLDVEPIKPLAWTIEASINSTTLAGTHKTFVGRDGNGDSTTGDQNRAPLYFKTMNNVLQILFTDEAGNTYDLTDSTNTPLSINTWYNVAAVSDGTMLKLYKGIGASGYQQVGSMALTPGDTRLNYDDGGSTTAGDTQWGWTIGRGRYGGSTLQADNHVDRWIGYIDEVRISDTALDPSQFLFTPNPSVLKGPTLQINRTTGAMTLLNQRDPVQVVGYSITSANGALDPAHWQSIADNFDATSGGEFDTDDEWTKLSAAGSNTDFSEFVFDTTPGNGAALSSAFSVPLGANGAWLRSPIEDIQVRMKLADGSDQIVAVEYTGNGGASFKRSDLNFDGAITAADWAVFRVNNLTNLSLLSAAAAYQKGDLDGDHDNDFDDFLVFKSDFNLANGGAGAFEAMLASVPEPGSLLAFALGALALSVVRRHRPRRMHLNPLATSAMLALAIVGLGLTASPARAAVRHIYNFNNGNANDTAGVNMADGTLNGAATVNGLGQLVLDATANTTVSLPAATIGINTFPEITLEAWATPSSAMTGFTTLLGFGAVNTTDPNFAANYLILQTHRGNDVSQVAISNSNTATPYADEDFATGPELNDNRLHFYAATITNSQIKLYVDGVLTGTGPVGAANGGQAIDNKISGISTENAWIGTEYPVDPLFNGTVDEVRIHNSALSDSQIADDYYFGPTPANLLGIVVNKTDGTVTIKNNYSSALTIDHYSIVSRGGALKNTWSGLGSLDSIGSGEGQSWSKAGGASANELAELFLSGSSTFDPAESHSIGAAYNPAVFGGTNGDLVFQFHLTSGERLYGPVSYVTSGAVAGDYNQDGVVNAADYTVWRDHLGQNTTLPNTNPADTDGVVTQAEYTFWKSRFGATSGSGAGGAAVASSVPEPTSIILLAVGLTLGLLGRGRGVLVSPVERGGRRVA